ncbi:hypothetical protein C1S70_29715 (plasmid) [Azospirillum argentinense]|uniref:Uncharacterized protein n=1 Tax=Azospirillum argentinense TaxID=2970906 RepID=A0A2K1FS25_9PROT|nr:hypothetical protein C1S70_29715 [Azospirillum argentinense]
MLIFKKHQLIRDKSGAAWTNDHDAPRSSPVQLKFCIANAPYRIPPAGPIPPREFGFLTDHAYKTLTLFTRF